MDKTRAPTVNVLAALTRVEDRVALRRIFLSSVWRLQISNDFDGAVKALSDLDVSVVISDELFPDAYSDEADRYSEMMPITIPGSCRSLSERSDAGLFHDPELIGISQPFFV